MIPEIELQKWFEHKAEQRSIKDYICNSDVLETIPLSQRWNLPIDENIKLTALDNAKLVYDRLEHARYISGDRSVSIEGKSQLRPDIIIITDEANCILVELKTNRKAERQTVQELLAYSSSIKSQLPYLNEHMFIIVAYHWDILLQQAVKSLLMDGKLVLPLRFSVSQNDEYQLQINESLFCFDKKTTYNPSYAMVPHTVATSLYYTYPDQEPNSTLSLSTKLKIVNYLRSVGFRVFYECKKIRQSGFVLVWKDLSNKNYEIINLTVVTVNQFWEHNDSTPSHIAINRPSDPVGLIRLQQRAANLAGKRVYDSYKENNLEVASNDLDFFFISSDISVAQAELYPQSSMSFDLLWRFKDKNLEESIIDLKVSQPFDYGGHANLKNFLREFKEISYVSIELFLSFGDVADFLVEKNINPRNISVNYFDFLRLMEEFSIKNR